MLFFKQLLTPSPHLNLAPTTSVGFNLQEMNARAKARATRTEAGHATAMHPADGAKLPGSDSLDGSITPRGPLEVTDLAGDTIDHTSFRQVAKVGLRMVVMSIRAQVSRRHEHRSHVEKRVEEEFQRHMEAASGALNAVENSTHNHQATPPLFGGGGAPVDHTALMLRAPNMTYQPEESDILALLPGADRVLYTSKSSVPPLCKNWVLLACPHHAGLCKKRHYYVDDVERRRNGEWRASIGHKLDMDVLKAITTREAVLEDMAVESEEASRRFFSNTRTFVVEEDVAPLLQLIDRLRLVTVQTVEAICAWRDYQEAMRRLGSGGKEDAADSTKGRWSCSVMVEGPQLWKASTEFKSEIKRFQRDSQPAKRSRELLYLGVFPTKSEAAQAYDRTIMKEAARRGTNPSRLPKKRFVSRSCNLHFAVEPATAPRGRACEQCEVIKAGLNGGGAYKPTYIYDGSNYLLKILSGDSNFVAEVTALAEFLGGEFSLKYNPLFLSTVAKSVLSGGGVLAPQMLNARKGTMNDSIMHGRGGSLNGLPPMPPTAQLPTPPAPGAPGGRLPPMSLGTKGPDGMSGNGGESVEGSVTIPESSAMGQSVAGAAGEVPETPGTLGTLRQGSTVRFEGDSQLDEVTSVNSQQVIQGRTMA